jgi:nitrogen regulation protein NR(I)
MKKIHVLIVDDDVGAARSLEKLLLDEGYRITLAHRGDEGLKVAASEQPDVVVTDLRMPGQDGLAVVTQLHAARPRLPIVLMTAFGTADTAIEATRHGAFEYLLKPFEVREFLEVMARAAANARFVGEPVELGEAAEDRDAIIGASRAMQNVYKEIGRIAATSATVLIRGETGTGKELVARALYQHGDRATKPFIAVNCAAIPETLLESELFGHERGAFTGADIRRIGRFEQAQGGTLFLDEIGDMSAFTQTKLLRVLQDKTIQRVGGKETISVDVRVIAATHRALEQAVQEHAFREDLYYRLSSVVIALPPLRDRTEDIPALTTYLLARLGRELGVSAPAIQPDGVEWLRTQPWPGNVRQLTNALRQALVAAAGFPIRVEHLQSGMARAGAPAAGAVGKPFASIVEELLQSAARGETQEVHAQVIEAAERVLYTRAHELAHGNQTRVARWLNVARQTVRDKWQHFGLRAESEAGKD